MASSALTDQLQAWITGLTVETAWTPPVVIRDPFKPGAPSPLMKLLRPRVTFELAGGKVKPLVIAPYGDPGPTRWPLVLAGGALVLGLVVYLVRR